MKFKILLLVGLLIGAITIIEILGPEIDDSIDSIKESESLDNGSKPLFKVELNDKTSLFKIITKPNEYVLVNGIKYWTNLDFELKEENKELYQKLLPDYTKQNTIVIYPIFTATAYDENGFYDYYKGECNEKCLTVPITKEIKPEMGAVGLKILNLLGYKFIRDIDVDKNPDILKKYDKVILLHNEYVTQNEFDAITSHPNVVYLYPNSLYAKVSVDYDKNTITLVRGHGYPNEKIQNGFDWKYDNTHPYEFDKECQNWTFYEIENGVMLNCYPDQIFFRDVKFLETIKNF